MITNMTESNKKELKKEFIDRFYNLYQPIDVGEYVPDKVWRWFEKKLDKLLKEREEQYEKQIKQIIDDQIEEDQINDEFAIPEKEWEKYKKEQYKKYGLKTDSNLV